jgi:hypothetical protein
MPAIAAMDNETLDHLEKTCGDGAVIAKQLTRLVYRAQPLPLG